LEPTAADVTHSRAPGPLISLGLLGAVSALYVVDAATGVTGADGRMVLRDVVAPGLILVAAATIAARARTDPPRRTAWLILAVGVALYGLGFALQAIENPPVESTNASVAANVLWLVFYPAAYVALMLLVRDRVERLGPSLWLDGLLVALTLGALADASVLPEILDRAQETTPQVIAAAVWFGGDVVLIAMAVWLLSLTGWRPGRQWVLTCAAFGLFAVGDLMLLLQISAGTYERGALTSTVYPLATLLLAAAAWQTAAAPGGRRMHELRILILPLASVVVLLGLLIVDHFETLSHEATALAIGGLAVAFVRAALSLREVRRLQESRRFEQGFEEALVGMALVGLDLRLLRVNRSFARMIGRSPEELVGRSVDELTHPEDENVSRDVRDRAVAGEHASTFYKRFVRSDGSLVETIVSTTLVEDPESGERYFFSQAQDITEERVRERRQEALAELGRDALAVTDVVPLMHRAAAIVTDALDAENCTIVQGEPTGLRFVAAAKHEEVPWSFVLPPGMASQSGFTLLADEPVIANDLRTETRFDVPAIVGEHAYGRGLSVPIRQRNAARFAMVVHATTARPPFTRDDATFLEAVANVLGSALDRVGAEDEVRRQALHDPLTGLANRALLAEQLEHALRATERHGGHVAVLLLDLDRFKAINDTLGHTAGDELLKAVAGRLHRAVREEDVVARLGGDEFVILCPEAQDEVVTVEVAERVIHAFDEPFHVVGNQLYAAASVGLAVATSPHVTPDSLLRDADVAMYRAKERGGARYEAFDELLRARLDHRITVETELRNALDSGELRVHFQPVVDLEDGRVAGFEALVRWEHPTRGLLLPDQFIGIAEESQLIRPIGSWVLESACEQVARWKRSPETATRVSVNLSPRQLTPALVGEVGGALDRHGLSAADLMLEITESLVLDQAHVSVLGGLRSLGVTLALDDFGTGYSSLASLQHQPIRVVKLDRAFIRTLGETPASTTVVRAVVDMASALGMLVVAEGVEDTDQALALANLGCRRAQGFLFGKAEPAPVAEALLRRSGTAPLAAH
jgi:diguanylate cyclase (GGDEF)-like protein/PAS domain S-box-containing protein